MCFANSEFPFEYDQVYGSLLINGGKEALNDCTFARGEFLGKQIPDSLENNRLS